MALPSSSCCAPSVVTAVSRRSASIQGTFCLRYFSFCKFNWDLQKTRFLKSPWNVSSVSLVSGAGRTQPR